MNYKMVTLGDIANFIRGITYKPEELIENFSDDSVVCMRTANVQSQLNQEDLLSVPVSLVKNSDKFLHEGDILVSTAKSWNLVGKCCWVPKLNYPATAGGFISILRAKEEFIKNRYLYHCFNSEKMQLEARNCGRQTTNISNMDINRCLNIKIPLPPLSEQTRIAAILDQADKIRQKRRRAAALADEFLRSVFLEMFGDPVTNPKGWELSRLGEECLVGTGSTPSRDNPQNFLGNIPWVKSTEVNWCVIHDTSEKLSVEAIKNTRLKIYPKNSIILALYGQGITRGKVAILGIEAALNQACAAITPMPNLNQYFLFSFLKYSYENLRQQARGGNQENLNLNIVKNYPIFIPSIELQSKWEKIYIDVENQIQRSDKQQKQLDNLFNSISQQFFAGSAGGSPAVCP